MLGFLSLPFDTIPSPAAQLSVGRAAGLPGLWKAALPDMALAHSILCSGFFTPSLLPHT
jgi:hypothetical protein